MKNFVVSPTKYLFILFCLLASGIGKWGVCHAEAPDGPFNIDAVATSAYEIDVTWEDDDVADEDGVVVVRSDGRQWDLAPGSLSLYDDTVDPNSTYGYYAYSYNGDGNSDTTNWAYATTPGIAPDAPYNLVATENTANQVAIGWSEDYPGDVSEYRVYRSENFGQFVYVGYSNANQPFFTDNNVEPLAHYAYYVVAENQFGDSGVSNTVYVNTPVGIPAAPSGLQAIANSQSQITLTWVNNDANTAGFGIARSTDGRNYSVIATTNGAVTVYVDRNLTTDTTYYYAVYAFTSAGNSDYSNTSQATTWPNKPTAPSQLSVIVNSPTSATIAWINNDSTTAGYRLFRSSDRVNYSQIADVQTPAQTSFADLTLSPVTTYSYKVYAYNIAGNSDFSNVQTITTPPNIPATPINLQAVANSPSQVTLTWTNNDAYSAGYGVQRSLDGVNFVGIAIISNAKTTTYVDSSVSAATAYAYRVSAYNQTGVSNFTNTPVVVVTPPNIPTAPASLTYRISAQSQVTLNWVNRDAHTQGYWVLRSTDGKTFSGLSGINNQGVTTYVDSGLHIGTTYYYCVYAWNVTGNSPCSNSVAVPITVLPPLAPSGLTAVLKSNLQITLSWQDNNSIETNAIVQRSVDGKNFAPLFTLPAAFRGYYDSTILPGVTYTYRVVISNSAGTSGPSNVVAVKNNLAPTGAPMDARLAPNFDGDKKTDFTIFDPTTDTFYASLSSGKGAIVQQWGVSGLDIPVPGDYDGDGKTDFALFRPSTGQWFIIPSRNKVPVVRSFGGQGDMIPLVGDFDGDKIVDLALYRVWDATWFILSSKTGQLQTVQFGPGGFGAPVLGDFDGDGKTDLAIYDPNSSTFYIQPSGGGPLIIQQWGAPNADIPIVGDYDGDGKSDIGVFAPDTSTFYIKFSKSNSLYKQQFGPGGLAIPISGDFDGDGKTDITVIDPIKAEWYSLRSSNGAEVDTQFGGSRWLPAGRASLLMEPSVLSLFQVP